MIEVLKQMVEALEWCHGGEPVGTADAIKAGKQLIAELESQEPHSWYSVKHDEWMTEKTHKDHERLNSYTHKVGGFDLPLYTHPPQRTEQEGKQMIDWYSVEGETRSYGVGMVECAYAIGRDEIVHVVTHESVKDIAMQHLPIQRTWQGLTDEDDIDWEEGGNLKDLVKAIEAKLKEKNT